MGVNLCPRTGGRGKDTIKILSLLERSENKKIARKKNNGSAAGGGAAQPCEPRSGELTRFFEIRSNLFENVHQIRV